jgi:hypothetical protein
MMPRERLPNRRGHELISFEHSGFRFVAGVGRFSDHRVAEIFLDTGKPNTAVQVHASDSAVLVSLLLQHGVSLETIRHSIAGPIRTALDLLVADAAAERGAS